MNIAYKDQTIEFYIISNTQNHKQKLLYLPRYRHLERISKENAQILLGANEDTQADLLLKPIIEKINKLDPRVLDYDPIKHPWYDYNINISNECDLRCCYCYRNNVSIRSSRQTMNTTQLQAVTKAILAHKKNSETFPVLHMSFHCAGEPTSNQERLQNAVDYIRQESYEKGLPIRFYMTTNCDYKGFTPFIIQNFASVGIFFIGPKELHDEYRTLRGDKSTYDQILRNIKALHKSKVNTYFVITMTNEIMKHWQEIIDFFAENFPGCTLRPFPVSSKSCEATSDMESLDYNEFYRISYKMYLYSQGKIQFCFPNAEINELFSQEVNRSMNKQLLVSSTKEITVCTHSGNILGRGHMDMDTGIIDIKEPMLNHSECSKCFCRYTCAAGYALPSTNPIYKPFCDLIKKITIHELNKIAADR